ncbi:MAG: c-type cytochrome [Bacteroidia bacterium]|nr:c-type cytochrome [Bacteroidia bacterium]NNC86356.1 c-type cytochrome [Bacteroidia bacterium]NNM15546.1 c-type cytochrome [Bacteroidia bacterium]
MKRIFILTLAFLSSVLSLNAESVVLTTQSGTSDTLIFSLFLAAIIFMAIIIYALGKAIVQISKNKKLWENIWNKSAVVVLFILANLFSANAYAQDAATNQPLIRLSDGDIYFLSLIVLTMFGIVLILFIALNRLLKGLKQEDTAAALAAKEHKPSVIEVWSQKLTDVVPIEQEEDLLFDHEYDGIRELDNNLPPWWKWMFYISIVFAVVYMLHYHVFKTGDLSIAEYHKEMRVAEANVMAYLKDKALNVDEFSVVTVDTESKLANGKKVWTKNCVVCHGAEGQGGTGPNMTDEYWVHGGDIKDLFKTIKYGVPEKGMQVWNGVLTPVEMQNVASYILTFQGTNPEGQKEKEGELYVPKVEEAEADTSVVE